MLKQMIRGFVALTAASVTPAFAGEAQIKTHKATGAVEVVDGAKASLFSSEQGIGGTFATSGLKPGHAYTMWVAIINEPAACARTEADHCTGADVMSSSDAVKSDVTFGDGVVADADGSAVFRTFIPKGAPAYAWIGNGLSNPTGAEIHFALHDHGPLIAGEEQDMLSTARGGCVEDSLPGGWPQAARDSGKPGPNQCQMAQFAILTQ